MPSRNNGSSSYKKARINEEVCRELAEILRSVKDPRVSGAFVSIVDADVTPDLKYCKVRYSVYAGDAAQAAKGIRSASGFIRRELAHRLDLRVTPELTFIPDHSYEKGAQISAILEQLKTEERQDKRKEAPGGEKENEKEPETGNASED